MGKEINYKAVLLARLDDDDIDLLANFDCVLDDDAGEIATLSDEMNAFLRSEAVDQQSKGMNTTTLLFYKGDLAAYVSVCADAIRLNPDEQQLDLVNYSTAPAIKIARLAVDKHFVGYGFGKFLIEYIRYTCQELNELLGIRYVTLDAFPHRTNYYKKLGFRENLVYSADKRRKFISMRSDYQDGEMEESEETVG